MSNFLNDNMNILEYIHSPFCKENPYSSQIEIDPPKKKTKRISHSGEIQLGDLHLPCFVCSDGTRLLAAGEMDHCLNLGSVRSTKKAPKMAQFLGSKSMKGAISKAFAEAIKIEETFQPIKAVKSSGKKVLKISGYRPEALTEMVKLMLDAKKQGTLKTKRQRMVANQAEIIRDGLVGIGINVLIDEATGYINTRVEQEPRAYQLSLDDYVSEHLKPWEKTFLDALYEEIFRLNGWGPFNPINRRIPQIVGQWTKELIYGTFPFNLSFELDLLNPKNEKGVRRYKHHQFLTDTFGKPELDKRIASIISVMILCDTWEEFKTKWNRVVTRH